MTKLTIEEAGKSTVYEIFEDEVAVGRGAANQIQLHDRRASKHHGQIRRAYGRWQYVDLESKNGTRVNGRYRNRRWLEPGDALAVGQATIRFDQENASEARPSAAAARPARPAVPPAKPRASAPATPKPAPAARPKPAVPARPKPVPVAPAAATPPAAARPPVASEKAAVPSPVVARSPRSRKEGMDATTVAILALLGTAFFIALMMFLFKSPDNVNGDVYLEAERLITQEGDYGAAIQYVRTHGVKGALGWDRLQDSVLKWEKILSLQAKNTGEEEADKFLYETVGQHTTTSVFTPKAELRIPEDELAMRLRAFLQRYGDSRASRILAGTRDAEPWSTYRRILEEHALTDTDVPALLRDVEARADALAAGKRYGEALDLFDHLKRVQSLLLTPDLYAGLAARADRKMLTLQELADAAFVRDMREVDERLRAGEKGAAIGKLRTMVELYGIDSMIRQAKARLTELEAD